LCYAGTSQQTLDNAQTEGSIPSGTSDRQTLLYPDTDAGNLGLCKHLAANMVMPNDTVTTAQSDAQTPAITSYFEDPASPNYHALGNITNPTLVLAGTQDEIVSVQDDFTLVTKIPGASFLQFLDAGHAAILQNAVPSGQVISAFLDAQ